MSSHKLPNVPSLRKRQLLLEFASLKRAPPPGIYVTINNPTDPTFWSGVLFVQKGPYASAILRFTIRFPPSYPELPPLVVFSTDIFHPLIVPLTTYTFTTGSSSEAPVSATDEERLPPGGFSLRHGFPHWFGRAQRTASSSAISSRQVSGSSPAHEGRQQSAGESGEDEKEEGDGQSRPPSSEKQAPRVSPAPAFAPYHQTQRTVPVVELLNYIRSTFDDETVLDSLPFDAAGNQGAWHAWRAHRNPRSSRRDAGISRTSTPDSQAKKSTPQTRPPGEWNWEGVWAKRVRSGIEASQSDAMLFGHSLRSDDPIRFFPLDEAGLNSIKEKMIPKTEAESDAQ
ncbi:hypothetical protein VTN49DRAFT_2632 [Thermomyces lanuginosus]|uniref:uncharacterized protein n=1 Tax=Thermomyces lanuginosus TaxID=5541 RepID=UPI0037433118